MIFFVASVLIVFWSLGCYVWIMGRSFKELYGHPCSKGWDYVLLMACSLPLMWVFIMAIGFVLACTL